MLNTSRLTAMLLALALAFEGFVFAQGTSRQRVRVVSANQYPGADMGAKINAADRALGSAPGEITVSGGGTISTQVVISSDHTLRLLPGTYVTRTTVPPILLKPRSSVIGSGWNSIITESTAPGQFTVIIAFNHSVRNGDADSGLLIRDLQIRGANSGFDSTQQAISLGNCSGCTVERVWINGTRSIGIALGGSSSLGHLAENSKVINSQFTRVASQNLALVNGRNILFEGNKFLAPDQNNGPGCTNIDLEPNESTDHIENVTIRNNLIDARESERAPSGNGILVQANTGTPYVGPILVENNTIIGGSQQGVITNVISNGIYVTGSNMHDVTVRNNVIRRTGQAGINLEGGARITVVDNQLTDVGGGGTPGFFVQNITDSRIEGNTFTYTGAGPVDERMAVTGTSRRNIYRNNRGFRLTGNTQ